jgi:cell division protein FtsN
MLRNADGESEILLGNSQLIGLFFLLAVLLGVSFTAGFMLGHGSFGSKKPAELTGANGSGPGEDTGQMTKVVQPPPPSTATSDPTPNPPAKPEGGSPEPDKISEKQPTPVEKTEPTGTQQKPRQTTVFEPQPGQTFLQVAAELHDSAASTASVLNRSGFAAHVVLAPNGKLFRVLVGPVKDKSDLSATRDALKKKGFLQVIVRTY